jgi:hypothetical protein
LINLLKSLILLLTASAKRDALEETESLNLELLSNMLCSLDLIEPSLLLLLSESSFKESEFKTK